MDKRILQTYSTWAKENLEQQIEVSLKALGINSDTDIKKAKKVGDKLKCILIGRWFHWWIDFLVPRVGKILNPTHYGKVSK